MITCKKRVFMLFQSPKKMMLMEKSHILGSIQNSVTIYHAAAATQYSTKALKGRKFVCILGYFM